LGRAGRELEYARYWVKTEDPIACAGGLAKVVMQLAHARLAHRGVWALNEKHMVEWADLAEIMPVFAHLGSSGLELDRAIDALVALATTISSETAP
jgi:hypothetical protein